MLTPHSSSLARFRVLLFVSSALLISRPAAAALITNAVVVDLSLVTITPDSAGGAEIFGLPATLVPIASAFTPAVGDTLQTTVTFANGDRLRIEGGPNVITANPHAPTFFSSLVFYFANAAGGTGNLTGNFTSPTTAVTFYDGVGSPLGGFGNFGLLGQSIMGNLALGESFTFSGLTLTTQIVGTPANPDAFTQFGLFAGRAGNFEVIPGSPTTVPDGPSTLLLLCGSLLAGAAARGSRVASRTC
jgi:hypothetical protein